MIRILTALGAFLAFTVTAQGAVQTKKIPAMTNTTGVSPRAKEAVSPRA